MVRRRWRMSWPTRAGRPRRAACLRAFFWRRVTLATRKARKSVRGRHASVFTSAQICSLRAQTSVPPTLVRKSLCCGRTQVFRWRVSVPMSERKCSPHWRRSALTADAQACASSAHRLLSAHKSARRRRKQVFLAGAQAWPPSAHKSVRPRRVSVFTVGA